MVNIFKRKHLQVSAGEEKDELEEKLNRELEKDITIHTMPKRFRIVHEAGKKAKTAGIFIIIGGAVFLVALSVLLYIYLIKNKPSSPVAPQEETPLSETSIKEESLPKADEESGPVIPVEEEIATTTEEAETGSSGLSAGDDSDGDGLTDKEENLFGSDINKADSDGDGYNDKSEVIGLYDPTGTKKLENGSRVVKYNNSAYHYNLIYPTNWAVSSIGGKDSIIFKSNDNHFVQVIVQANTGNKSIADWYRDQISAEAVSSAKIVEAKSWSGIKSEDNFTLYLTDSANKNIYIITYNFGNNNIVEYGNVFEMIIKSFETI